MQKTHPVSPLRAWGLVLLLVCGCAPAWTEVIREQREIEVRDPATLGRFADLDRTPPATVSRPAPIAILPQDMSLDEAIRIALQNAKVIRVLAGVTVVASGETIYDPAISNTTIDEARAVFDPIFGITNNWNRSEQPQAFLAPKDPVAARISGVRVDDYDLGIGLSKKNVSGGTAKLEFTDVFSRFHPGIFPLNPQERSALTLSYTQPLLRGAGPDANLAPIVIARINTERSYFQFKDS